MIVLDSFSMGDVEDPDIYVAEPLFRWQESPKGKWCMENCTEAPEYSIMPDPNTMGYRVVIKGRLDPHNEIIYRLKFT